MLMTPRVERARRFALVAHSGQKYGDEFPYIIHLQTAYSVAVMFNIDDEDTLCAVWCHDVQEDTKRTKDEIASILGDDVAAIIDRVSEPDEVVENGVTRKLTRKEKHAIAYPRITGCPKTRLVKLCDRISHVQFGGKKVNMYRNEHKAFKTALGHPHTRVEEYMWSYLDSLLAEIP